MRNVNRPCFVVMHPNRDEHDCKNSLDVYKLEWMYHGDDE